MNYLVSIVILCLGYVIKSHGYYYWKDYQKKIPLDAYVAAQDSNNENVYIGQAFLYEESYQGIYPTSIRKNKDVYIAMFGVRKTNYFVQILCSTDPLNLIWIPANSTHLHLITFGNEVIRGGIETHNAVIADIAIGRARIQGDVAIGKVMLKTIGSANMWFVHNEQERKSMAYEVLTYKANQNVMGNGTVSDSWMLNNV